MKVTIHYDPGSRSEEVWIWDEGPNHLAVASCTDDGLLFTPVAPGEAAEPTFRWTKELTDAFRDALHPNRADSVVLEAFAREQKRVDKMIDHLTGGVQ